ncbi:hypothetical protein PUN4_1000064 [Paraburkholderia unamae]|nr:hypothetical protein PUN4_1000064 [Paraburkholderia unamae]
MDDIEALGALAHHAHERQLAQPLRITHEHVVGHALRPAAANAIPAVARHAPFGDGAKRVFVIAEHGMEPRLVEERERLLALFAVAAIDEIAHRKQPVVRGVEVDLAQQVAQGLHATMQIAYNKIATCKVGGVVLHEGVGCVRHYVIIALCECAVCAPNIVSNAISMRAARRGTMRASSVPDPRRHASIRQRGV